MKPGSRVRQSVVGRSPIPFARPAIGAGEANEVLATLASGWLTTGPRVQKFEREFARLGRGPKRDRRQLVHRGAASVAAGGRHWRRSTRSSPRRSRSARPPTPSSTPVRRRCSRTSIRRTCNLDPAAVERAITPRTRAILPVHYAGRPADVRAFQQLAEAHGLVLIEDAAHAVEAVSNAGRRSARRRDFTCFSFYATKNLTTGEGGMVTSASDRAASWIRTAALHGMSRDGGRDTPPPGARTTTS